MALTNDEVVGMMRRANDATDGVSRDFYSEFPAPISELVMALADDVLALVAELRRHKDGSLTSEEFQHLCHNLHKLPGCTQESFRAGCREYQEKLFGLCDTGNDRPGGEE